MTYRAPINDMLLALNHGAGLQAAVKAGHYGDFDSDIAAAVLEEAGRFASDVLAPLNRIGDENGIKLEDNKVTTAPGWPDAYKRWTAAGWNAVSGPEAFGGQGLPLAINAACTEIWSASNIAFGLCPLLTLSAIEALDAHGSEELKKIYLEKLVSGEWTGTMQLTEPQAGSDVGALRTRAERAADGSYRISGTKIFITYGDHDMTDNIVHFVLARLPDAPAGTKGISLFLVPKFLVNADGSLGARNDIYPSGVEHKLGIHASPTCTMTMGDKGGAVGYLIGEENRGMLCMFTMMNQARLGVGLEGVGIADRAYQQALAFAQERRQGRAVGKTGDGMDPIIVHPDIKRMLMQMRALTAAARTICYATAVALDVSVRATDSKTRGCRRRPRRVADADRQGVLHRYRQRGHLAWRPGPWRHGIYRGDRRRAALSRCAHHPDLRRHQRHPVDRSCHPQTRRQWRRVGLDPARRTHRDRDPGRDLERSGLRHHRRQTARRLVARPHQPLAAGARDIGAERSAGGSHALSAAVRIDARRMHARRRSARRARSRRGRRRSAALCHAGEFFAENISVQAAALERTVMDSAEAVNGADAVLLA